MSADHGRRTVSFFDCFNIPLPDVATALAEVLDEPGGLRYRLQGLPRHIKDAVFNDITSFEYRRSSILLNYLATSNSQQLHEFFTFLRSREYLRHLVKEGVEHVTPISDTDWVVLDDQIIARDITSRRRRQDWKDILKLLPFAGGAPFDRGLPFLKGTRVQILEEINKWFARTDSNVLWVYGPAGSGKSTVATEVARRLETDGSGRLGATFFCSRADHHTQDPTYVFPTIAFQLANSRQPFMDCVSAALRNEPHIGRQSVENQFVRLIREPLAQMHIPDSQVIVVILDALDECGDATSREHLLRCLDAEIETPTLPKWFKLLITSRPHHDIRLALSSAVKVPIKLDSDANRGDLNKFILDRMSNLVNKFHPDLPKGWPGKEQVDQIESRAQGLFLWVNHLYNFIKSGNDQDQRLDLVLSNDFNGGPDDRLYNLYSITLNHICKDEPEDFFEHYRSYMGGIITAKTPLTSSGFCSLIRGSKRLVLENIVWRFGSVLYKDGKEAIRVVHPSLVDFLTSDSCADSRLYINLDVHNAGFAHSCLEILSQTLKFNMCELSNTYQVRSEVQALPLLLDAHVPEHVRYSCQFWTAHLQNIPTTHTVIYRLVNLFFRDRVFYWLEVLSLLNDLERALASLRQVQKWVKPDDDLQHILDDLQAFIIRFYPLISQCAPHIYLSALPFSPKEHAMALQPFRNQLSRIPSVTAGSDCAWGSLLGTAPGHGAEVTGLAFSANGERLVSCSEDMTVRVWEAETGEEVLGPLRGHSKRLSWVAVTSDASKIASVSNDLTARIWDGTTGAPMFRPLKGHTKWVSTAAFSPCGTRVVTGSFDMTSRIWELGTSKVTVLEGHTAPVSHVAFSPNGKRVVSGSFDTYVRVWDARSGAAIFGPLKGHSHWVRAVLFSPDNSRIVSGSSDRTIRIWDAERGTSLLVLQGHSHWVLSLAFSPDGKLIASGSYDTTVRVWESETGQEALPKLEGHSASVKAVAFSPNGNRLLSVATDMTQQAWDVKTGQLIPKILKSTTHTVCSAAVSNDDKYMALGFSDGTVRMWDSVAASAYIYPSVDPASPISSMAFSPAAEFLFYRSSNSQVRAVDISAIAATESPPSIEWDNVSSLDDAPEPFRLESASGWILDDTNRRTLWIPIYFRDRILASSTSGTIVLRNKSGRITLLSGVKPPNETEWLLMTQEVRELDSSRSGSSEVWQNLDGVVDGAGSPINADAEPQEQSKVLVRPEHVEHVGLLRKAAVFLVLLVFGFSSISSE